MKTITATEFYAKPAVRQKWKPGQVILVTTDGKPDLVVRKLGLPSNTARGCVKEIPLSGGVGIRLGKVIRGNFSGVERLARFVRQR